MDELDAVARTEIQAGWHVIDADGEPIGSVADVTDASFTVRVNAPGDALIAISFDDIESADEGRVALAVSGEELAAMARDVEL